MPDNTSQSYILNYATAIYDLGEARDKLHKMTNDPRLDDSDRADAAAGALDITQQLALLASAHAAFLAQHGPGASPPSAAAVQRTFDLAHRLSIVIATANKASAIINAVTSLVNGWATLTAPAAVAAPAAGALVQLANAAGVSSVSDAVEITADTGVNGTPGTMPAPVSNRDWLKSHDNVG